MARIVAERLEERRRERGLSQRALADAAGVTRQAVGAIESGRMQPGVGIALALARALDTTVEALFGAEAAAPPARLASAAIGDRTVTYPLDRDHLAIEPTEGQGANVFLAGCDVAVGLLARHAAGRSRDFRTLWLPMTNAAALEALQHGRVHAAVVHGSGGAVARSREAFACYELATTEEGWLLARGNPRRFHGAGDLTGSHLRLVNRPAGAGARRLLDEQLRRAGVDPQTVAGYDRPLAGQLDAGRAIAQGFADAAVGLASVAQLFELDFLSLREERCTLLVAQDAVRQPELRPLLEALRSTAYRRDLAALTTYDIVRTGERIA